jgi:outer membrane autotransporter protein
MGVLQGSGGYGPSPWIRYFDDRGDVSQGHASNFGQGGTFGFDQSSSGWEAGVDARPGANLHVGVLVGKSEATQRLQEPGAGSDRLDARTFGLYGTWTGERGFYLDASYRWTGFDARLRANGLHYQTNAEAGTFNVEAGFTAWNAGGFEIQPQAQYTRTRIGDIETLRGPLVDFDAEGGVSERGRLGVAFTRSIAGGNGWTWTPYGVLSAVREFDGKYAYALSNGFAGETRIDGTSALVEAGVGARHGKLQLTGGLNWTDGGAFDSFLGGQVVARYNW